MISRLVEHVALGADVLPDGLAGRLKADKLANQRQLDLGFRVQRLEEERRSLQSERDELARKCAAMDGLPEHVKR